MLSIFLLFIALSVLANTVDANVTTNSSVTASNNTEVFADATVSVGAGITPDSGFYFVEDKIFTKFRGDVKNREKKFAEIRAMIETGNYEAARTALVRYREYADNLEREISPDEKEEAQRSAAAIRNALKELEAQIPADQKKDFVDDIRDTENRIDKAAEIAAKVKELCETLSKLDPLQYEQTCRTEKEESSPQWQRNLDKKLTEEQKKEAREFEKIMRQCMQTSGRQCKCQDIAVKPFAEKCSVIAPLATKCDEGDEEACQKVDSETQSLGDLLPEHLQEVLMITEERMRSDQFENHMPPECEERKAKTPKECMRIMFEVNAPEECVAAAKEGKIDFSNERRMRESCEEVMFKANAPQECVDAGLRDHKECGKLMFKANAPQECVDAGLTGESPRDGKKCEEIMRARKPQENGSPGRGFALGRNCKGIQDKEEKLKCFEEAYESAQASNPGQGRGPDFSREGEFRGPSQGNEGSGGFWPEECRQAGINGNNPDDGERCGKIMRELGEKRASEGRPSEGRPEQSGSQPGQQQNIECPQGMRRQCENNRCFCTGGEQPNQQQVPPQGMQPPQDQQPSQTQLPGTATQPSSDTTRTSPSSDSSTSGSTSSGSSDSSSSSSAGSTSSGTSSSGESSSTSSSPASATGSVIFTGNAIADNLFIKYFYRL